MQPHAVSRVLAYDGKVLKEFAPDPLRQALSKEPRLNSGSYRGQCHGWHGA